MVWKGLLGFLKFRRRMKKGSFFPAFQFISVTNDCNLNCQGCWVNNEGPREYMAPEMVDSIIESGKKAGSYFFGILGGEPLMYRHLMEVFSKHPECYFQLFTNGTLFTRTIAYQLRNAGNVTPLISLEGDEQVADIRRGGHSIYKRTLEAIRTSIDEGLITGVAISVCKSNIEMALSDDFINLLHEIGVLYIWYYIYRPAGKDPNYGLALDLDQIVRLRKFLVEGRKKFSIILIDSYWRANGEPFCPAAEGLSHHINPAGFIEPCPVVQIAKDSITNGSVLTTYRDSQFLEGFRNEILSKTRGCVFMEEPAWICDFAHKHDAINSSGRPDFFKDLENAPLLASHGSCPIIPERNLLYKIAKRTAFFGMGAYG